MTKKEAFLNKLGKRITALRKAAGMSQTELAAKIGRERQNVNRLEKGGTSPTLSSLLDIASALNVTVSHLLDVE